MTDDLVTMKRIGTLKTPFKKKEDMPIQGGFFATEGRLILDEKYSKGLKDLDEFSHAILIYTFHRSEGYKLEVRPFLDDISHGVFSTRAPKRPNPIGLTIVRIVSIKGNTIVLEGVDMLDDTPLLDIKPYVPQFDARDDVKIGWLKGKIDTKNGHVSDDRFSMSSETSKK